MPNHSSHIEIEELGILFSGDSGDGVQFIGNLFSKNISKSPNYVSTNSDFPAEIRAPIGTIEGISTFQTNLSKEKTSSQQDKFDILVSFNANALIKNIGLLKKGGIIIADLNGFEKKYILKTKDKKNPLEKEAIKKNHRIICLDISKLCKEILTNEKINIKNSSIVKNLFALGMIMYLLNKKLDYIIKLLQNKFQNNDTLLKANTKALKHGFDYCITTELFEYTYKISRSKLNKGNYTTISGNEAITLGLLCACKRSNLDLFYSSYPITPASNIFNFLHKYREKSVITFQAEDEIAAINSAIGASFGGSIGTCASSGPGISLMIESMALCFMLELPLIIINIQRAGPSTGMPTKAEQADLLQALYSRSGEAPIPVLAASSPSSCFDLSYKAIEIAIKYMTPVIVLSDAYIANNISSWKVPQENELNKININNQLHEKLEKPFLPFRRDKNLSRKWIIPGTKDYEHCIGGLEKENISGKVSYDGDNHEYMNNIRKEKIINISQIIPKQKIDLGDDQGDLLVISWGCSVNFAKIAINKMIKDGYKISFSCLEYIFPFPKNIGELLKKFKRVAVIELNKGQLSKIIREKFLIDVISISKTTGKNFETIEICEKIQQLLKP